MLESVHIINAESGICLFIKKYTSIPIKEDIIFSGFLKAIEDLSQETKNESVQEIILNESKLVFYKNAQLIVVGITPKTDDSEKTRSILKDVGDQFIEKYKTQLKYFSGKISDFNNFSEIVDKIIEKEYGLVTPLTKNSSISFDPINRFIKYIRSPTLVISSLVETAKDFREKTVSTYREIIEIWTNRRRYTLKEKN